MTTKHILPTLLTIAIPALLGSCSTEEDNPTRTTHSAAIIPTATINMAQTSSRANELSGPISGETFPINTNNVFAVTAYKSEVDVTDDYSNAYFHNQSVNSSKSTKGEMTFNKPQYYPNEGELYFYAYSPVMEESPIKKGIGYNKNKRNAAPTVTFDISDGQTDILWAQNTVGIANAKAGANQEHPNLQFEHKLQKLQFKFVKDKNFKANCEVTQIRVTGVSASEKNDLCGTATLNLINGKMKYKGKNKMFKLKKRYNIEDNEGTEIKECLLIRPTKKIKLTITYKTNSEKKEINKNVTLDGAQTDEGGKSYLLTIKFLPSGLDVIITIEKDDDWIKLKEDLTQIID